MISVGLGQTQDGKYIVKIDGYKIRLYIPRPLAEKYKIEKRSLVLIEDLGDGIKISPAAIIKKPLNDIK